MIRRSFNLSLLKSVGITLKIGLLGSEYTGSHNHQSNLVFFIVGLTLTFWRRGSPKFIKNGELNGTVDSPTDLPSLK